jgi:hypothetical protein
MPYYTLGGAGRHFPRLQDGRPVFPENMRRPGRILRRLERILERGGIWGWDEDWREVGVCGDGMGEKRMKELELDGEWFDCHDVQGYLESRGFVIDSAVRLRVPGGLVAELFGAAGYKKAHTLDMECFFDCEYLCFWLRFGAFLTTTVLLANLRILGRAPGFRAWDVDAALRGAISRRPFEGEIL